MKRPALKAALSLAVGGKAAPAETERELQADNVGLRSRAAVRVGRRQIAGWFAPEVARQLHMIALEEDTTLQALMAEAFNDVFTKRGKPPIA
jgi:hypothetical protein